MSRTVTILLAITVFAFVRPMPASAQSSRSAKAQADKGAREYNLGHFPEAISAFEKAYEIDPAPILLFNIAQAHRQSGDNERAIFFYRRYLEQAPNASNRADVEKRVHDLDEMLHEQSELKRKPPPSVEPLNEAASDSGGPPPPRPGEIVAPLPPRPSVTEAPAQPPVPEGQVVVTPQPAEPVRRFGAGVDAGLRLPFFGGRTIETPTMLVVRLQGTYRINLGNAVIDVGLAGTLSPLPYVNVKTLAQESSTLIGLLATAGIAYPVATNLLVFGNLDAGVVWWSGIGVGDPFTLDNAGATGAIPMPSAGVGAGVVYELPRGFFVAARAGYSYMKTTSGALTSSISSISVLDLAAGGGVRF
jgi:hypothetical protein